MYYNVFASWCESKTTASILFLVLSNYIGIEYLYFRWCDIIYGYILTKTNGLFSFENQIIKNDHHKLLMRMKTIYQKIVTIVELSKIRGSHKKEHNLYSKGHQ